MFRYIFILSALVSSSLHAAEVRVAVAANFQNTLKALSKIFEQQNSHRILITSGSTGKLYAQIQQGAPFDILLAADEKRPRLLEEQGLAVAASRFTYASGKLVLWSITMKLEGGERVLREKKFDHLALANPKTAPYGKAAVQAMQKLNVWSGLQPKVVMGENVGQVFQFIATLNADLGFVALAQILDPNNKQQGSYWEVPTRLYQPIKQDAVLLSRSTNMAAARKFLSFLQSPNARDFIRRAGYGL